MLSRLGPAVVSQKNQVSFGPSVRQGALRKWRCYGYFKEAVAVPTPSKWKGDNLKLSTTKDTFAEGVAPLPTATAVGQVCASCILGAGELVPSMLELPARRRKGAYVATSAT